VLSSRSQTLLDTARYVDMDVKSTIEANQKSFFNKNPELCPSNTQLWLTSFLCDVKRVPVLGWIIKKGEQIDSAIDTLKNDIRHWWKCGGEELVMNCLDIVIKVGLAVAAVITAVIAVAALTAATLVTGGAILLAVAACVAAVIAVVNAVTNIATSVQAIEASNKGHPAMSRIYGSRDTLAQVLREENFKNRFLNRLSCTAATVIEITDAVAGIILIVQSIGKAADSILSNKGIGFAFKELARGSDGKLTKKVTLSSIWRGTKAFVLNKKLTTSTAAGLRTTFFTNISQSAKYRFTLLKYAFKDPKRWINTKQIGDLGLFGNTLEKIRYNLTLYKKADPLTKVKEGVDIANRALKGVKMTIEGLAYVDDKGLLNRISEQIVQKTLFDNDYIKLIDKTGIGSLILRFDKSNIIRDFGGIGKGLLEKLGEIKKSIDLAIPEFYIRYPYFEYGMAGGNSRD
jgi:hypothetical protein